MMARECYICGSAIGKANSALEHIIPNFLGGKISSRAFICKTHNNTLSSVDNTLLSLTIFANQLNVERDRRCQTFSWIWRGCWPCSCWAEEHGLIPEVQRGGSQGWCLPAQTGTLRLDQFHTLIAALSDTFKARRTIYANNSSVMHSSAGLCSMILIIAGAALFLEQVGCNSNYQGGYWPRRRRVSFSSLIMANSP